MSRSRAACDPKALIKPLNRLSARAEVPKHGGTCPPSLFNPEGIAENFPDRLSETSVAGLVGTPSPKTGYAFPGNRKLLSNEEERPVKRSLLINIKQDYYNSGLYLHVLQRCPIPFFGFLP